MSLRIVIITIAVTLAAIVGGYAPAALAQSPPLITADRHNPLVDSPSVLDSPENLEEQGEKPFPVQVGMQFINWEKLDTKGSTFRFVGILCVEWNPAALPEEYKAKTVITKLPMARKQVQPIGSPGWHPTLLIINSMEEIVLGAPAFFQLSNGKLRAEVRIHAPSILTQFNFRRFPFDTQVLLLKLAPDRISGVPIRLEPLAGSTTLSEHASMLEWKVREVAATANNGNRLDFSITMHRYWPYYMANTFVPMFMLVCVSYSTLWIARTYFAGAFSLVAVTIASLFLLKLNVTSNDARAIYFTFLDAVASLHLLMACSIAIMDVVLARNFAGLPDPKDEGLAHLVRLFFPIFYVAAIAIIFVGFLWF